MGWKFHWKLRWCSWLSLNLQRGDLGRIMIGFTAVGIVESGNE